MTKQLLIVGEPECIEPAKTIIGESCDVASYSPNLEFKDRKVVYWPTAPGEGASERAKAIATTATEVKVLVTSDKPTGWNAAAAMAEGWTIKEFIAWAKPNTVVVYPDPVAEETPPTESQLNTIERLGLAQAKGGAPICNAANVVRYLEREPALQGKFWFDDFTGRIYFDKKPWDDHLTNTMMVTMQTELGMHRMSAQNVFDGIMFVADKYHRNQVREWISQIEWDKKERIASFFPLYLGGERSASNYAFSSNFWVSLVHRIFEPGCQADYMVVLEGEQGIGKTRTFQIIGGDWYAEIGITADSEDFERQLQGKIVVEIAELHSFSKTDQSRIKQIITKRVDRYREKYGKIAVDHPRQGVLVGTTNETSWIKDQTGGRRFWPVKCGEIDLKGIKRDRDQFFAEALIRYRSGDPGYLLPKEEVAELQEERREAEPWEELLKEKLMIVERISLVEAMALLKIPEERMDARLSKRIAHALRRLGYATRSFTVKGESKRFWYKNGIKP